MTVKLELDPQVLAAAEQLAELSGRSVGAVVSDLARMGLNQSDQPGKLADPPVARVETRDGLPVIVTDPPARPIDLEAVRRELEEHGF